MDYDEGGFPWYVTVAWVGLIVSYAVYMMYLAWPDLMAWMDR